MLQANFPKKIIFGESSIDFLESLDVQRVFVLADESFYKFNPNVFLKLKEIWNKKKAKDWIYFWRRSRTDSRFCQNNS